MQIHLVQCGVTHVSSSRFDIWIVDCTPDRILFSMIIGIGNCVCNAQTLHRNAAFSSKLISTLAAFWPSHVDSWSVRWSAVLNIYPETHKESIKLYYLLYNCNCWSVIVIPQNLQQDFDHVRLGLFAAATVFGAAFAKSLLFFIIFFRVIIHSIHSYYSWFGTHYCPWNIELGSSVSNPTPPPHNKEHRPHRTSSDQIVLMKISFN